MCNYLTTVGLPCARAPGPAADRGANPRGTCAGTPHVDRGGTSWPERAIYKAAPPAARPLASISRARLRSAPAALISLSCPSTAAHHALAHAPRIKKDVPARKAVAGAQPVNIEQWVNRSDRRRGTYHSVHGRNKLLSIACL